MPSESGRELGIARNAEAASRRVALVLRRGARQSPLLVALLFGNLLLTGCDDSSAARNGAAPAAPARDGDRSGSAAVATSPNVSAPVLSLSTIPAGQETLVTATATAAGTLENPLRIRSLRLGRVKPDNTLRNLGRMRDDGTRGDAVAGDGIYTIEEEFLEALPGQVPLVASARFKHVRGRVRSPVVFLNVARLDVDDDLDGFSENQGDCNDADNAIHPGAPERCNSLDDDCDNTADDGFDAGAACTAGVGACAATGVKVCTPDHTTTACNAVPGAPQAEICGNGIDEDCDGEDPTCQIPIAINSPQNLSVFNQSPVLVSGTVGPEAVEVECAGFLTDVGGGVFSGLTPLREGRNAVTCIARSLTGVVGTATIQIVLDTAPPVVVVDSPPNGFLSTSSQIDINGTITDATSVTIEASEPTVIVNGLAAAVANRSFVVPRFLLQPGVNAISISATDAAGNVGSAQLDVTLLTDAEQRLQELSGNSQSGTISELLPEPLVVRLTDRRGNPLAGRPVIFAVTRGDGTVSAFPDSGRGLTVRTDDNGLARVNFALGTRVGKGNHQVTASAAGVPGSVVFCASAEGLTPVRIVAVTGGNQTGAVGTDLPLPLVTLVTDPMGNPVPGVEVLYQVTVGGGTIGGASTFSDVTDSEGHAAAVLTLGGTEGLNNNVVTASFTDLIDSPASFSATALAPQAEPDTRVSGLVLDNQDDPVPGATARIEGTALSAVTDEHGRFSITGAPVGALFLIVDGTTTSRPGTWPELIFELITVPGRDNTVGMPIRLLPIDTGGAKVAGGSQDVTIEMAGVPGAELTVFANSATFPDGSHVGTVSFTQVHADKVPMQAPLGSNFMLAFTVQPRGTRFDPPARVSIPNMGAPAGEVVEMFSFDHDIGEFVSIGTASVTEDGTKLVSNPGFGIRKAGWGGCVPPPPPNDCVESCDDDNPCTDDSCENGSCVHERNIPEGEDCHKVEIEAEVIDQDDPKNMSFTPFSGDAVYGGSREDTSDNLKLKAETDDDATPTSYSWSVTGPGSGNYGSSSTEEWVVGEIRPVTGMLQFKVQVTFSDGEQSEAMKDIEVGVRTDDIMAIGWIDPNNVPLSGAGMDADMLAFYPVTCNASMGAVQKGLTFLHLGVIAAGSTIHPVVARSMTAAEKTHVLNWMFKCAANFCSKGRCPPTSFADDDDAVNFQRSKRTSYKLFNRFKIKYRAEGSTFKGTPEVLKEAAEIGVTNDPVFDSEDPGRAGPNNARRGFLSTTGFLINDGTPASIPVRAFNTLTSPLKWNNIGSRIEFSVAFGTGKRVFTQVYPTYFVFDNFAQTQTIPQAAAPIGNFNTSPYPPGPAPYIP